MPYPTFEHFFPKLASKWANFGKKCSFFDCVPRITGRSAESLAVAHFEAEIKLQIAELWTAAGKNDRRTGWQANLCSYWTVAGWIVNLDRLAGGLMRLSDSFPQECSNR